MVEKQSKRILPQLFSCIQKQKDITVITLLTIRKYQSIAFCIVKLPFWNMVRMDGSRDPLVSIYVSELLCLQVLTPRLLATTCK